MTHDLAFLGDVSGGRWKGTSPEAWAVCSCGWADRAGPWSLAASDVEHAFVSAADKHARHVDQVFREAEIAHLTRGNACRYCFAPLDDVKAWYCGDTCKQADRVRPKGDALESVLDAHRVESFEPGPDQLSMFEETT